MALVNKGVRAGAGRPPEEAIAVYDDLVAGFGGAKSRLSPNRSPRR